LSILHKLRLLCLCYFSKPVENRPIYRAVTRNPIRKIVELGVSDARRALRMIEISSRRLPPSEIHYVGMDPFEGRAEAEGKTTSLKTVHQQLRMTGARVQLVPGNPAESLIRLANSLGKVDLLIVPGELDSPSNARMWFFVPRMLHDRTRVFVQQVLPDGRTVCRLKSRGEIEELASLGFNRRAA
jgi:hypothetical protein